MLVVAASAYRIVCTDVYHLKTLRFDFFIFFSLLSDFGALLFRKEVPTAFAYLNAPLPDLDLPTRSLVYLSKIPVAPLLESAVALSQAPFILGSSYLASIANSFSFHSV